MGAAQQRARKYCEQAYERQGGKCYWCGCEMTWGEDPPKSHTATAEHLKPRADGGRSTKSNIVAACAKCNHTRGATSEASKHNNALQSVGLLNPQKGNKVIYHKLKDAMGADKLHAILKQATQAKRAPAPAQEGE